jgi:hypothetical protein
MPSSVASFVFQGANTVRALRGDLSATDRGLFIATLSAVAAAATGNPLAGLAPAFGEARILNSPGSK